MAALNHFGEEKLAEPRRRFDVDSNHGHVLFHRPLDELALPAKASIVDQIFNLPVVFLARVKDDLSSIALRKVNGDRMNFDLMSLFYPLGKEIRTSFSANKISICAKCYFWL